MKLLVVVLFFSGILLPLSDISILGIRVGDTQQVIQKLPLKVKAKEGDITKFQTKEGNDFSITCQKGKVVYMENDWLQDAKATKPLFSDFTFGQTSLHDIRTKFGTNGFAYKGQMYLKTEASVVMFNCFEVNSANQEVLVVITKAPLNGLATEKDVADRLKLDALIISKKEYLDGLWGEEKVFDTNYKKIDL